MEARATARRAAEQKGAVMGVPCEVEFGSFDGRLRLMAFSLSLGLAALLGFLRGLLMTVPVSEAKLHLRRHKMPRCNTP